MPSPKARPLIQLSPPFGGKDFFLACSLGPVPVGGAVVAVDAADDAVDAFFCVRFMPGTMVKENEKEGTEKTACSTQRCS